MDTAQEAVEVDDRQSDVSDVLCSLTMERSGGRRLVAGEERREQRMRRRRRWRMKEGGWWMEERQLNWENEREIWGKGRKKGKENVVII